MVGKNTSMNKEKNTIKLKRKFASLFLLALLFPKISSQPEDLERLLTIETIRHGSRSPVKENFLKIKWKGVKKTYNFGQLTPAGYREHFLAGYNLAKTTLETSNLTEKNYKILSSAVPRTFQSAFSRFIGIKYYEMKTNKKKKGNFSLKNYLLKLNFNAENYLKSLPPGVELALEAPIIHNKEKNLDEITRFFSYKSCKKYFERVKKKKIRELDYLLKFEIYKQFFRKLRKFLRTKEKELAKDELTFKRLSDLGDFTLSNEKLKQNRPFFEEKENIRLKLKIINNHRHLSPFTDLELTNTLTSPYFLFLRETFNKKIFEKKNKTSKELNYYMISAHDTTITPILVKLGLIDFECSKRQAEILEDIDCFMKPIFASNLKFELFFQKSQNLYFVSGTFNDKRINICGDYYKDGSFLCEYGVFSQWVSEATFVNWEEWCKKKTPKKGNKRKFRFSYDLFYIGLSTLLAISLGFMSVMWVKYDSLQKQLYKTLILLSEKEEEGEIEGMMKEDLRERVVEILGRRGDGGKVKEE